MTPQLRRAVFLDRDGTINEEVHFLAHPQDLRLLPGAAQALVRLRRAGLALVVLSNQSGLARGLFSEDDLLAVQAELVRQLAGQGAVLDGFYHCPHLPEGRVERYATICDCRKPRPGLVLQAARELGLALEGSFMVGDRLRDVACGRAAGLTSILVQTGQQDGPPASPAEEPHLVALDLAAAADWILERMAQEGDTA